MRPRVSHGHRPAAVHPDIGAKRRGAIRLRARPVRRRASAAVYLQAGRQSELYHGAGGIATKTRRHKELQILTSNIIFG